MTIAIKATLPVPVGVLGERPDVWPDEDRGTPAVGEWCMRDVHPDRSGRCEGYIIDLSDTGCQCGNPGVYPPCSVCTSPRYACVECEWDVDAEDYLE